MFTISHASSHSSNFTYHLLMLSQIDPSSGSCGNGSLSSYDPNCPNRRCIASGAERVSTGETIELSRTITSQLKISPRNSRCLTQQSGLSSFPRWPSGSVFVSTPRWQKTGRPMSSSSAARSASAARDVTFVNAYGSAFKRNTLRGGVQVRENVKTGLQKQTFVQLGGWWDWRSSFSKAIQDKFFGQTSRNNQLVASVIDSSLGLKELFALPDPDFRRGRGCLDASRQSSMKSVSHLLRLRFLPC